MESGFDELVRKDVERFQEKLGLKSGADIQMILLKAHLLVEEQLQSFIDGSVKDPSKLTKAKFSFSQKMVLAEALHADPTCFGLGWVWEAVRALNSLRNQMAHNLEPRELSSRLVSLNQLIESSLLFPVKAGEGIEYEMARFGFAVSVLNVRLTQLLHSNRHPAKL